MTLFVILLRLSANRDRAPEHREGHKAWIGRGIADGVFLLVGTLHPTAGGAIIAVGPTRDELEHRVNTDPFVVEDIVRPEIFEITPSAADERLDFVLR